MTARSESRPLVPYLRDARRMAAREYAVRPDRLGGFMGTSRGSDGGMHYRHSFPTRAAADAWAVESTESFARRIVTGELDGVLVFDLPSGPEIG